MILVVIFFNFEDLNAVIDIGNTRTKVAIFNNDDLDRVDVIESIDEPYLKALQAKEGPLNICVSAVKNFDSALVESYSNEESYLKLSPQTKLPIENKYKTPETLGNDRLASVIGAHSLYGRGNLLVIDAGTCLKFDYLNENLEYLGGAISPGLRMRFKALETFTGKLPLIEPMEEVDLIGNNTKNSILSGVVNGMKAELNVIVSEYENKYPGMRVYMTGGDLGFFDTTLKSRIFAAPYLVLRGLNTILNFNLKDIT